MIEPISNIGMNIKRLRKAQGMTLEKLSKLTHVTRSMISQIENNKSLPSLKTLQQLSSVLRVAIGSFFESEEDSETPVHKKKDRQPLKTKNGVNFSLLTKNVGHHNMEILYNVYEPNGTTGSLYSHEGEECGIVLKGKFEVIWNRKKYIIEEGDSIYLDSSKPHKISNIDRGESIAIWINSPPTW
ncbi:MAG: helix-turn-helix domain-containing protein [Spirochaetia bacterium]